MHISEVADNYVENVNDHLTVGDEVEVKVLTVADDGKISLSIKKLKNVQSAKRLRKKLSLKTLRRNYQTFKR